MPQRVNRRPADEVGVVGARRSPRYWFRRRALLREALC